MNKTKFKIRHIKCNIEDFNLDRHRFRFEYNGKEYIVPCYTSITVDFKDLNIPDDIQLEIADIIFKKIDKEEYHWRYPLEAYEIANNYVEENFD